MLSVTTAHCHSDMHMYITHASDELDTPPLVHPKISFNTKHSNIRKQGNSVARDLPPIGSEANTTILFLYIYIEMYFLNVGNSIKREENMKYCKQILKILFFQYLKNS